MKNSIRMLFVLAVCFMLAASLSAAEAPSNSATIGDKTLVAWLSLANTKQRAGSALTLFEPGKDFDAIVFGEKTPGRWMNGSGMFRRTEKDDSDYPMETAGADETIQMAIVYDGPQISIFRNGKPYADYKIEKPLQFSRKAFVLIGLRYLGPGGSIGPLAGAIEEARIYDKPLNALAVFLILRFDPLFCHA